MPTKKYWRINCQTDGIVHEWSSTTPTVCPINPAHILNSVTMVNENICPSMLVEVIVGPDQKSGNFTSIAEAFAEGNTHVFVKNGTYTETSDIVIPNGGKLVGQKLGSVIINLSGNASITIDGSGGTQETTGTISIVSDTTTVSGLGTTFTNLSAGQYIQIDADFYEIDTITNDTTLELKNTYRGTTKTDISFVGQGMFKNITIQNLQIKNSTSTGMFARAVKSSHFEDIELSGNDTNIQISDCGECTFSNIVVENAVTGPGIEVDNSCNVLITASKFFNNTTSGLVIKGSSRNNQILNCNCFSNGQYGVDIQDDSYEHRLSGGAIIQNKLDGLRAATTSNSLFISALNILKNGINGINIKGNSSIISDCMVLNNVGIGICIEGDKNNILNNNVQNNGSYGIDITSSGNDNTIVANKILTNGNTNFRDNGTDSITGNNAAKTSIFSSVLGKGSSRNYIETSSRTNRSVGVFTFQGTNKETFRNMDFIASTNYGTNSSSLTLQDIDGTKVYGTASPTVSQESALYHMTNIGVGANDPLPSSESQLELVYNNGGSGKLRLFSFSVY